MDENQPVLVPIPALVLLLLRKEKEKGSPLTKEEVLSIRDNAVCMTVPYSAALLASEQRGYDDISLENAWEDWCQVRPALVGDDAS
ncbi:hypothetical protein CFR75_04510 [Komagataeibacter xylinus]|uniref:Uncharacterized protein n=1 Tax=Komagataeibacter xylinus TaxID=28448 RepID=A0A318PL58_KOMXY|nr:hypothetical protein [Komagataeibacter xylinus]AZV39531.1 hypothetical protein CXP35_12950 [Komagataeibacter xylinus]PYD57747.1 hypothetical protein CFR75_04510 [Komagataeibacter xylinus]GBQ72227.1 hypothetical protein AA15237_1313 [Komagataeibacter xylinus NBRC 15237]